MARSNTGKGGDTGERLIDSMRELLWERGYTATSPAAVQQRAGAGQGSMYHHFRNKAGLALAAERRMGEDLREEVEQRFAAAATTHQRIEAYLAPDAHVTRGCRLGRLIQDEEVAGSEELREPIVETYAWIQERIRQVLDEGVARGELRADVDTESLAVSILAIRQGAYALARLARSEEPFRQAGRGIAQLLALAAPEGAPGS
ncbi:TetR/AcrR family transcriptional regulator [Kitasatospora viridis]|uniref:TetR family transcriptional regulator n=1 Tax=Kitasatospora viridis TaxID=281105 RepID=A0A561T672_9ACTN|nr:TetR/AcrR family transcriptional regulator [Kitasatospora viridis]TWF82603.1 TetR family transcriptional regulator [Kitasatospora viridis]